MASNCPWRGVQMRLGLPLGRQPTTVMAHAVRDCRCVMASRGTSVGTQHPSVSPTGAPFAAASRGAALPTPVMASAVQGRQRVTAALSTSVGSPTCCLACCADSTWRLSATSDHPAAWHGRHATGLLRGDSMEPAATAQAFPPLAWGAVRLSFPSLPPLGTEPTQTT